MNLSRLLILVLCFCLSNCGWKKKATFDSPDHKYHLTITAPVPDNSSDLRIQAVDDKRMIFEKDVGPGVYVDFMQAVWCQDAKTVAFFGNGTRQIEFAFNFALKREMPFEVCRQQMAEAIRQSYQMKPTENPFDCFRCAQEFVKRHPEQVSH